MESDQIDGPTVLDFSNIDRMDFQSSVISAKTGKASYEYIIKAIELANSGQVHGIATAPINKYALSLAGIDFPGHEILEKFPIQRTCIMLLTEKKFPVLW